MPQPIRVVTDCIVDEEKDIDQSAHINLIQQLHEIYGHTLRGRIDRQIVEVGEYVCRIELFVSIDVFLIEVVEKYL
jgi:hypothetical protein